MRRISVLMLALFACLVSVAWPQAQRKSQFTFDAPGAGTAAGQGTIVNGINVGGAIAGWYVDAVNVNHGFLRAHDGSFTSFDAAGAGTGAGQGTFAVGNNPAGAITGLFVDANGVSHGFVLKP